jgi:putative membrane protein
MPFKTALAVVSSAVLFAGVMIAQPAAQATTANHENLNSVDRNFINNAEEGNLAEIQSAKVVEQKAANPAVKDFASRMVTDHTQLSQELKSLATSTGATAPSAQSAAEATQKNALEALSGVKLDDVYLRGELSDHKQAIDLYENEIEHGESKAVRNYAKMYLPTLQDHIRIAEDVAGKMDLSGRTGLTQESKAISAK